MAAAVLKRTMIVSKLTSSKSSFSTLTKVKFYVVDTPDMIKGFKDQGFPVDVAERAAYFIENQVKPTLSWAKYQEYKYRIMNFSNVFLNVSVLSAAVSYVHTTSVALLDKLQR